MRDAFLGTYSWNVLQLSGVLCFQRVSGSEMEARNATALEMEAGNASASEMEARNANALEMEAGNAIGSDEGLCENRSDGPYES